MAKRGYDQKGLPTAVAIGSVVSILTSIVSAGMLAWLLSAETIGERYMSECCFAVACISAMAGSIGSAKLAGRKRLAVTATTVGVYFLLLLLLGMVLGGVTAGVGSTALAVILGGGVTLIPSIISGKSGAGRVKIKAYR